jgi:hypothetical protein
MAIFVNDTHVHVSCIVDRDAQHRLFNTKVGDIDRSRHKVKHKDRGAAWTMFLTKSSIIWMYCRMACSREVLPNAFHFSLQIFIVSSSLLNRLYICIRQREPQRSAARTSLSFCPQKQTKMTTVCMMISYTRTSQDSSNRWGVRLSCSARAWLVERAHLNPSARTRSGHEGYDAALPNLLVRTRMKTLHLSIISSWPTLHIPRRYTMNHRPTLIGLQEQDRSGKIRFDRHRRGWRLQVHISIYAL